ncbi:MAG TPA: thermonuclease family protein [Mesorhizobium sp.]|jgi:endonuclease YncB( thermonuclease family)
MSLLPRRASRPQAARWWRKLADYGLTALLLGLLILIAARLDRSNMQDHQGRAVINDGDSITLGTVRVRLLGIDAPEYLQLCHGQSGDYACGKRAREALVKLIGNRPVSCKGARHDRYGRLLGDCTAGHTRLNQAQVEAGWAVAYGDFEAEEASARAARLGIWAGTFERPQDWRRDKGVAPEPAHDDILARAGDWLRQILRFW